MFQEPWRTKINRALKAEVAAKIGCEPQGRCDFVGAIGKALRSVGIKSEDEQEEVGQALLAELFTKGGPGFFEMFDPERGRDAVQYTYIRALWRCRSYVREQSQARREMVSLTPDEEHHEIQIPDPTDRLEDGFFLQELLALIESHLQGTRPKLRLPELWNHVVKAGLSKGEAAAMMNLRGPNITHRLFELRQCIIELCDEHDLPDLKVMLENGIAHLNNLRGC